MEENSTVDIDLAKSVFQIHAIDARRQCYRPATVASQQMLKFFEQLAPCPLGWRRAALPTTGRELGIGDMGMAEVVC
ncbi:hypothetical protein IHQ72_32135 [Mesorhizobium onobrychidis]|uniref:Transposase n=1 Tax=Mesorhizobium onobrychidis TaxID=2775404 RepID=A0ABY5QVP9_9HYPH|nr:hypothetical protein [Mesorhizobium onobrychidis]UVC15173.1 hypothetical protein IHQ72_32135 [Mesorhizobium onobrychidis]